MATFNISKAFVPQRTTTARFSCKTCIEGKTTMAAAKRLPVTHFRRQFATNNQANYDPLSNTSTNPKSWWRLALGLAGGSAAIAAAFVYLNDEESADTNDESSLNQALLDSVQNMRKTGKVTDQDKRLFEILRKLDREKASGTTRINACLWLTVASGLQNSEDRSCDDLTLALRMLEGEFTPQEQQLVTPVLLAIELAALIPFNPDKVLDKILSRTSLQNLTIQEIKTAFLLAPWAGRWKTFRELGRRICHIEGSLEQLHEHTTTRVQHPDLKLLYETAEALDLNDVNSGNRSFKDFRIRDVSMRFHGATGDDAVIQRLKKEFDPEGKGDWIHVPVTDSFRLQRLGGFASMQSFSIPLSLVGPFTDDRISLKGCLVYSSDDGNGAVKQTERYDLRRSWTNQWQGTYVMDLHYFNNESHAQSEFDIVIDVEPLQIKP